MIVRPISTRVLTKHDTNLEKVLDQYVSEFSEGSILAITSKVVALSQGRTVEVDEKQFKELVTKEADSYLPAESNRYDIALTIKDSLLIPNAGIDHSNGNGSAILWPKNPQKVANDIRSYLTKRFNLTNCGVLITDSTTRPLRWGVTGVALAHSGFAALNDYRGKPDIFNHPLAVTQANVADALATAAVFAMGEGAEQTPLAVISDVSNVAFQDRGPTKKELDDIRIDPKDDLYGTLLTGAAWKKNA